VRCNDLGFNVNLDVVFWFGWCPETVSVGVNHIVNPGVAIGVM